MTVHSVSPGLVADAGLAADREERLGAVGAVGLGVVGLVGCCREKSSLLLQAGKVGIYIYTYLGGGFKYFFCSPLPGEMIRFH